MNIQVFKLDLEKAEEPEIKLPTCTESQKKQDNSRNKHLLLLHDYTEAFDCVNYSKLWTILQEMGISDHFTCLLYEVQEATVKTRNGITSPWLLNFVEQISQLLKIVYCLYTVTLMSPLTCVQSTSWEMPGWMKHKLESILPEEISLTSYMEMIPPLWQKTKWNLRDCWWKWKRRGKKLA